MLALIAELEAADPADEAVALHGYEARARMLRYVADRVGVQIQIVSTAADE